MKSFLVLLTLSTALISCKKDLNSNSSIVGTTWEIWQYRESSAVNPTPLNDTIFFVSTSKYKYNGFEHTYTLTNVLNAKKLTLYGTVFGDVSGNVPENFNTYGEIIAAQFYEMNSSNNETMYVFWMKKID